tara:strand:- start:526 stop:642 length:117 start_codon:yes stop_codon:yes gene_type:complete
MKDGMTRIEVSKEIYSAEQEVAFLGSQASLAWYNSVVE